MVDMEKRGDSPAEMVFLALLTSLALSVEFVILSEPACDSLEELAVVVVPVDMVPATQSVTSTF